MLMSQSLSIWNNNGDWIKIEFNYIIEEKLLTEIETSKLYYRRQYTCRILSITFMEEDMTQSDTDFCENNAAQI